MNELNEVIKITDFVYNVLKKFCAGDKHIIVNEIVEKCGNNKFLLWLSKNYKNDVNSTFLWGYFNYYGIERQINYEIAFIMFTEAVKMSTDVQQKGFILAKFFKAKCWQTGNGTARNESLAFDYFKENANDNFPACQFELALCYYCFTEDYQEAINWFEKAANNGILAGKHYIGKIHFNYYREYENAFRIFLVAANEGFVDSMLTVGGCYYEGKGTTKDMKKGFEYYERAALLGNEIAQYILGKAYLKGEGIQQDKNLAIEWFKKSSEQNYYDATKILKDITLYI